MKQKVLTNDQVLLLQKEKTVLSDALNVFARFPLEEASIDKLKQSIAQLDELFLIVVVGEFNAGKSALINALLGADILEEGVTPTTASVKLLRYGEQAGEQLVDEGFSIVNYPLDLLKEVNFVDSPGTNALNREHERLTEDYVPRSDHVLFISSADRPMTESERQFLERIISWGKKVSIVINKIDILENAEALEKVLAFTKENASRILGFEPEVFLISAKKAQKANQSVDPSEKEQLLKESGIANLDHFIKETLDDSSRLKQKLLNPLGVARHVHDDSRKINQAQLKELEAETALVESLEELISKHEKDLRIALPPRLAEVENILNAFEKRGLDFFESKLKISNIFNLAKSDMIKLQFQEEVQADVASEIENKVRELIDWTVDKDLDIWYRIANALERRQIEAQDLAGSRALDEQTERRHELISRVSQSIRTVVSGFDRKKQVEELGDLVQDSVAKTALFGVGAAGIGILVATVITARALDITGIVSAGTLAVLGIFVIPFKRKQAKDKFIEKMSEIRESLRESLSKTFKGEFSQSVARLRENISPYTAYVRSESEQALEDQTSLAEIKEKLDFISKEIESVV